MSRAQPRMFGRKHFRLAGLMVVALVAAGLAAQVPATPAPVAPAAASEPRLTGTVTGAGQALAAVWVSLVPVVEAGAQLDVAIQTITDSAGRYEFADVAFDQAKLHVRAPLSGGFVATYWPSAYSLASAGILNVSAGAVTADVDLSRGGSVAGQVVDRGSGAPVPDAQVTATIAASPSSPTYGEAEPVEGAGRFRISGLPPVPMHLLVRFPPDDLHLAPPYSSGSSPADLRFDGAANTADLVVRVGLGAEINGTVRDDAGAAVAGAVVGVTGCRPACPQPVTSDTSGAYRITAIPPGSSLRVVAWEGNVGARVQRLIAPAVDPPTGLLPQWFSGQESEPDATLMDLLPGEVRSADFRLVRGAFVTIQVLGSASPTPLKGVIALLKPVADPYRRHFAGRIREDPTRMRFGPVAPGSYTLRVNPGAANPQYLPVTQFVDEVVAPLGVITLESGDRVNATVRLPAHPGYAAGPDTAGRRSVAPIGPRLPGSRILVNRAASLGAKRSGPGCVAARQTD